jgi:hypothetical protein
MEYDKIVGSKKPLSKPAVDERASSSVTFNDNPKRDAHRSFAGYVYQVDVSIYNWLRLHGHERLELESGEDIDLIRNAADAPEGEQERTLQQLKDLGHSITLRSEEAREAIANFCHHRSIHPNDSLRFRFLTTAAVGKERAPWADLKPGIDVWEDLRTDQILEEKRAKKLQALRSFLKDLTKPDGLSEEVWASLRQVLNGQLSELETVVDRFEWATGSGDHDVIEGMILEELLAQDKNRSELHAREIYRNLFTYVIKLLTRSGLKELTTESLHDQIANSSVTMEDHATADRLRAWTNQVDAALAEHEGRITALESAAERARNDVFYTPAVAPVDPSRLFDFNQVLQGRSDVLADLSAFLQDDTKSVALLPGRGGVGKSKLLREWVSGLTGWTAMCVNPYGTWSSEAAEALPDGDIVLLVDDAHRYSQIDKVVALISATKGNGRLKIVLATRPSGVSTLNSILAVVADETVIARFPTLEAPSPDAILAIAREVLGPEFEHLAQDLARVSLDTPLVTVVGGRLIAKKQIRPELLNSDKDFRHRVMESFTEAYEGNLPVGGRSRRELLHLIASVQPVEGKRDGFAERGASFMRLRSDQIRKGLDDLDNQGVLLRSKTGSRITPDLLGDYLLEDASFDNQGEPTGFADEVFEAFETSHLSNLLKNLAELDWRITQDKPDSELLNSIWSKLYTRFRSQKAHDRIAFLLEAKAIAVFQPRKVLDLVAIAMDEPAEPGRDFAIFRERTQDDVVMEVPALLEDIIYDESSTEEAFRRLWVLLRYPSDDVRQRARKALETAMEYRWNKNPLYNQRFLSLVESMVLDSTTYRRDFSPLDLVDKLLDREIENTTLKGRSVSIGFLPVPYEMVDGLRTGALRAIDSALYSEVPKVAVRAARSMAKAWSEFHPRFRNLPTKEEQEWQDRERLTALEMIERRIEAGRLSLPLTWKIDRSLAYVERRDAQTAEVKTRAAEIRKKLVAPSLLNYFDILSTNQYEDADFDGNSAIVPQSRHDHENQALADLAAAYHDITERVKSIEAIAREADEAGLDLRSLGEVIQRQCLDTDFLRALTEFVLANPSSLLAHVSQVPLARWRDIDPAEFERYGLLYARSEHFLFAVTAAEGVSKGPALKDPIKEDMVILTALAQRTEGRVLGPVLFGLKRLVQEPEYSEQALSLYANMKVGNDYLLAKEYCEFFGSYGLPADYLNPSTLERILENLVDVDELERDAFGGLLARTFHVAPQAFVRLLERRIERRIERGPLEEHCVYEPIPSTFSWSSLANEAEPVAYAAAVESSLALMVRYPFFEHRLTEIFWHVFSVNPITMSALDDLLHRADDDGLAMLLRIVRDGPDAIAFSQSAFAMHILDVCSEKNGDLASRARQALIHNAMRVRPYQVFAGSIPPEPDNRHIDEAKRLADLWEPRSPAHQFYAELAEIRRLPMPSIDVAEFFGEDALSDD